MFCRNCGTENSPGSASCVSCGAPLMANPYQAGAMPTGQAFQGEKPKNYLVQSILVTLCCCLPLGIVSIVYAAQVDSKWNAGDLMGAVEASKNANKWGIIAFACGIVATVVWTIINVVAINAAPPGAGPFN